MASHSVVTFLVMVSAVALTTPDWTKASAEVLQRINLNCISLGTLSLKEAIPNDDIRSPLADFMILTLPSGATINLISNHGANVWNWTSPNTGITFSKAAPWPKQHITFKRDSYGYKKGIYWCN